MTRDELLAAYEKGERNFGGVNLGGANLCDANLCGANLRGADLGGADLGGADLGGADLRGADLGGADLGGADLRGADLGGADLGDQWIVQGPARKDGYFFSLQKLTADKVPMVKAGCHHFTLPEAREHWGSPAYPVRELGDEALAIIDHMVALATMRGYIKGE
jgi:hypothetical protein